MFTQVGYMSAKPATCDSPYLMARHLILRCRQEVVHAAVLVSASWCHHRAPANLLHHKVSQPRILGRTVILVLEHVY